MVPKQILSHLYKPNILVILNHVRRYCQRKTFVKRISFNIIFTCTYRKCFKKTLLNHNIGKNLLRFCKFLVYIINQIFLFVSIGVNENRFTPKNIYCMRWKVIFISTFGMSIIISLDMFGGVIDIVFRYFFLVSLDLVSPLHCISTSININVPVSTLNMKTVDAKNEDRMFVCQITKFAILFSLLYFRW